MPAKLRENPNKHLAKIRMKDVVKRYSNFISQLDEENPSLIVHSMGGLIVQKLIQDQKGSLGICITSASTKGILTLK